MTEATAAKETARIDPEEPRKTLAEWYAMFEENGGDLVADSAIERLKGGRADDTKARRCESCEVAGCIDCVLAPARPPDRGTIGSRWSARAAKTTSAPVNYYDGEACMDACRLACRGRSGIEAHLVASAIQYLWRSGRKGPALPDLLKAKDMIERLVREAEGGK